MAKPKPQPALPYWYSGPNMLAPQPMSGGGWFFDFVPPAGYAGYLVRETPGPLSGRFVCAGSVQLSDPPPVFDYWSSDPANQQGIGDPASASLCIFRRGLAVFSRWWSVDRIWLDDGAFSLSVPLTPDHWFSSDAGTFAGAIREPWAICLTFGGGSSRGHGVAVTGGSARFVCEQFGVVP